ncbi:hypothetical protein PIB30_081051 [Stylosanthes scabra]|uniref:Uncharacterized protein n=1 Tax=Stylosanthes scabra TaxID=79078 RepID=A0ABU6SS18_9FABA|nr:hypothetical protein [Stylosanthes scabra]
MTHGLNDFDFTYGIPNTVSKVKEIISDWKDVRRVKSGVPTWDTTPGYPSWQTNRGKWFKAPVITGPEPPMHMFDDPIDYKAEMDFRYEDAFKQLEEKETMLIEKTRLQSKALDDLGHAQEEIKEEMNQMKEQIAKILEALQAMSANGIPAVLGGERTNVPQYPPNFGSQGITIPLSINSGLTTSMPLYGLPPGYTPPIATYSDNVATTQNVIQPNMDVSQAFPSTSIEGFATTRVEPQIFNIPISSAQTYPATALSSLSKEKLETLEERLRAIEGVNNYGLVEAQ